jgi:methylated-DNA-protein-cysteine methyltransferase-like protein
MLSELMERRLTPIGIGWAIRAAPEGSIPWHRVVNASGGISTDREQPGLQRAMLEAEGVRFDGRGCVNLSEVAWRPRVVPSAGDRGLRVRRRPVRHRSKR